MTTIFISYSSADRDFARVLGESLESVGVTVWLDEEQLRVGDDFWAEIERSITSYDYFGVVVSASSVRSSWVEKEIAIALQREVKKQMRVVPIRLDAVTLPTSIATRKYADFSDQYETGLQQLLTVLEEVNSSVYRLPEGTVIAKARRGDTQKPKMIGNVFLGFDDWTVNALVVGVGDLDAALQLSQVALESIQTIVVTAAKSNPKSVTPEILPQLFEVVDLMIKLFKKEHGTSEIRASGVASVISISHAGSAHTASLGQCCAVARWSQEDGIAHKRLMPKASFAVDRVADLSSPIPFGAPLGFLSRENAGTLFPQARDVAGTGAKIRPEVTPLTNEGDYVALLSYELSPEVKDITAAVEPIATETDPRRIAEHFVREHAPRFDDCMVSVMARL